MLNLIYDEKLLEKLKSCSVAKQGAVGDAPSAWAKEMGLDEVSDYNLPETQLTRQSVKEICQSEEYLKGYICAMSWGGQGRGPGGSTHVKNAWKGREKIEETLKVIREGHLSRKELYNLFCEEGEISGLGPAYFTKLLYFFDPCAPTRCYIMDQWTTKPILLLTNKHLIRHANGSPSRNNRGANYEIFCKIIEDLAEKLKISKSDKSTAEDMEERLFSVGSIKRQPRGEWRQVVYDEWIKKCQFGRYDRKLVDSLIKSYSI